MYIHLLRVCVAMICVPQRTPCTHHLKKLGIKSCCQLIQRQNSRHRQIVNHIAVASHCSIAQIQLYFIDGERIAKVANHVFELQPPK